MKERLTNFLLLVCLVQVSSDCDVTEWSQWSSCGHVNQCENQSGTVAHKRASWKHRGVRHGGSSDRDRASRNKMAEMMATKSRLLEEVGECRQDGTCPQNGLWPRVAATECKDGMANGYPCWNIDLLSFIPIIQLLGEYYRDIKESSIFVAANDIWGWVDPVTKVEWAVVGTAHGTSFVSLERPADPKVMAFMPTRNTYSPWRDMKVIGDTTYVVSEATEHGLQVFDLTRLRDLKEFKVLYPDLKRKNFGAAHNIVANEERKFVYVVGARAVLGKNHHHCLGGLHIINVTQPLNPQFVGCFADDGYTHDAQCVIYRGPDIEFVNHDICFCFNEDTLTIVDLDNPKAPVLLSVNGYANHAYTHQGWITEDQTLLLLDDELDEEDMEDRRTKTFIWDIKQLRNPKLLKTHYSRITAIDHNQYIKGPYTYQSNYAAGLRILHIDQKNIALTEVAYFDVDPDSADAVFRGTWSNYPYFPSGVVPVTSIERGLFILRPRFKDMENVWKGVARSPGGGLSSRRRSYVGVPDDVNCQTVALVETRECEPESCEQI